MTEISSPFRFCFSTAAQPEDYYHSCDIKGVPAYLNHLRHTPQRAFEFERAIESAFENAGLSPRTDAGWKKAGIADDDGHIITHAKATQIVCNSYLNAARLLIDGYAEIERYAHIFAVYDPDYKNYFGVANGPSPLQSAASALRALNLDPETDEAWQMARSESLADLRQTLRAHFVAARVGDYAYIPCYSIPEEQLRDGTPDTMRDQRSEICADMHILEVLPKAAARLGITPVPGLMTYGQYLEQWENEQHCKPYSL